MSPGAALCPLAPVRQTPPSNCVQPPASLVLHMLSTSGCRRQQGLLNITKQHASHAPTGSWLIGCSGRCSLAQWCLAGTWWMPRPCSCRVSSMRMSGRQVSCTSHTAVHVLQSQGAGGTGRMCGNQASGAACCRSNTMAGCPLYTTSSKAEQTCEGCLVTASSESVQLPDLPVTHSNR